MFCEPKEPFLETKCKQIFCQSENTLAYSFQFMKSYNFLFVISKYSSSRGSKKFIQINNSNLAETILPEIFIWFFINSNPNLTKLKLLF